MRYKGQNPAGSDSLLIQLFTPGAVYLFVFRAHLCMLL